VKHVAHPRVATRADIPNLQKLIEVSARALSVGLYTQPQTEAAITHVFGVDTQLIADKTYYVIEENAVIVAAGGWSARRTLYGGDQAKTETDSLLDPRVDAARIRAFFVHPAWTRRGLARQLFAKCEKAAKEKGFRAFELVATLPGVPFYRVLGFEAAENLAVDLPGDITLPFVRMHRAIGL
jgi:GNAT superfamily N-acetyltransferase